MASFPRTLMNSQLRARDCRALMDALDQLYTPVAAEAFPERLFDVLAGLFPGTIHSFDSVELATGQVESHVTPAANSMAPVSTLEAAVGAYVWQNPVVNHLAGYPSTVVQLHDLTSQRQFRRTDFYQHCHRPLEIKHQVAAGIGRRGHAGAFVINRGGTRPFDAREVELVSRLRPHVAHAFANLLLVGELRLRLAKLAPPTGLPPAQTGGIVQALTRRETEVFGWLEAGKRDGEIAVILGISVRTVHKHVEHILAKLGVETRTAAATSRWV